MTEEKKTAGLSPAMRWTLIGVGAVVVIGVIVAVWLLTTGGRSGTGSGADGGPSTNVTQGPLPDATPTSGSEVLPPTGSVDNTLPPVAPPVPIEPVAPAEALVPPPYPASATAEGDLAAGFPVDVLGPMPASDVISSSIATEGSTMQVTLEGRTDTAVADVRAYYAQKWAALGLQEQSTSDGSLTYTGRGAALSLSANEGGTGIRYTLFGVFRAS
ncbi:hypothetical protein [Microbacterium sp. CJ88]|uniref:hypothetical protein n=1 Tax=Microbacterium sp. CJ88 TaxID=3445672 RepID=UPI003F65D147